VARASGALTPADVFEFLQTQRAGRLALYTLLFDARLATVRAGQSDVQQLAERVTRDVASAHGIRGAVAIVASGDVMQLARTYEALCHGAGLHVIRVFRSEDEARRWLGW